MFSQNPEIYSLIVIAILLGFLLVGFIVVMLFLYQKRQHQQEQELEKMKVMYEKEALKSQLEIQETTFKNIAQELHDNIGQLLSVVKISLSILPITKDDPAYEGISSSRDVLNKAIYDLSNLTKSLHTDHITEIGLTEAIWFELEAIKKTGITDTQYHITGDEQEFTDQKAIFLFRIFQEAINNCIKHSKARAIIVNLKYLPDLFVMEIIDNGIGFKVNKKDDREGISSQGVGLKSMFNRAKLIGADLVLNSYPSKGTSVKIHLPLTS